MYKTLTFFLFPLAVLTFTGCPREIGTVTGLVSFTGVPCQTGQTDYRVPPCSGPYPRYEIAVFQPARTEEPILSTMSDKNGRFRIDLPAGDYLIFTQNGPRPDLKKENPFTIQKDQVLKLDLRISTGIQ